MQKIAFIGLGNMGLPMAANLLRAGYAVTGYDPAEPARQAAEAAGLALADDEAAAAQAASVVITMLPSGKHVLAAYPSLLAAAPQGTLFIDGSTIDVASARAAHDLAAAAGMVALDAPVSGGVGGAAAATLTFMAGGEHAIFEQARPVLQHMGKRLVHCGAPGAGQAAKICNNMILGISMIAVSEAFLLADTLGLSHQALFDVASASSGQCWALTTNCPVPGPVPASPANRDYAAGFAASLMLKDLRLSQEAGAPTELGRHATRIYAAMAEAGLGGLDFSAVIRQLRSASF